MGGLSWLISDSENNNIDITERSLNDTIEILKEKFDYSIRRRERLEQELLAAYEDCAQKKREIDLAMEEKRKLTRMKLAYGNSSNNNNKQWL